MIERRDCQEILETSRIELGECLDRTQCLLTSVQTATAGYFNSTPVIQLTEEFQRNGTRLSWPVRIDLKTLTVIAAVAQAPLILRGSTDRGKTALAEQALTGLFGPYGERWWRIELNRALDVEDLVDVDTRALGNGEAKLSEAIAAARWLSMPGRLLDESNRAHAKLLNLVIHLADGSGFNVRGDLNIPVGMPYQIGEEEKRFSFTILTANHTTGSYAGTYEEDQALVRRAVVSVDLDEIPPSGQDRARMRAARRAKATSPTGMDHSRDLVELYESLPKAIPFSALATMLLHHLAGRQTCVRARSGQLKPSLKPGICQECHLAKSTSFCGRVGGLTEGLFLWVQDLSVAVAAVRAASVLARVHQDCTRRSRCPQVAALQKAMGTKQVGEKLFAAFRASFLSSLCVTAQDVEASYRLVAPTHVWIDPEWLSTQSSYESNPFYVLSEVARDSWRSVVRFFREHSTLVETLVEGTPLSDFEQSQVETYITTRDPATLSVIDALRDQEFPVHFRHEVEEHLAEPATQMRR